MKENKGFWACWEPYRFPCQAAVTLYYSRMVGTFATFAIWEMLYRMLFSQGNRHKQNQKKLLSPQQVVFHKLADYKL